MKSEDDPEARIRELEQPLAEAAHASEAAADQSPSKWAPPSGPPMPPPSGSPMSPPPPLPYSDTFLSPRTGMLPQGQIRWIMLAVFVIGMICLPLVIFHFSAQQVPPRSGLPTMLPFPEGSSSSPTPSGTMPHTSAGAPTTAPAGGSLSVAGINESRTEVCKDMQVRVSGVGNQVVLTGHCASLSISGVRNKVIVDATESIQASGFNNDITYLIGTPHIDTSGTGNLVHKG
jgi:Protein of unknown function (DUF3060)